jgi:predicted DNA-binding transcriptional regulator AlpA
MSRQSLQDMSERRLPDWPRGLHENLAAAYVGLSPSTIRVLRELGEFPAPVSLTKGRQVWLREQLDEWLDKKAGKPLAPPVL